MPPESDRIEANLSALSSVPERYAGTEGERAMLHAVKERLPEGVPSRIEAFVDQVSPALWYGVHALALLIAGTLGYWHPGLGALACGLVTASLLGEGTGWYRILRWPAPRKPAYNLVVKNEGGKALGTVIISTPLDIPRWRPQSRRWVSYRPLQVMFGASALVTGLLVLRFLAQPWGRPSITMYAGAICVLFASVVIGGLMHRSTGTHEEASGPVTLLELQHRFSARPVAGVQLWTAWTACGRAFQGGMRSFLELHGQHLPQPILVIALDDCGRTPLHAVVSEGQLFRQRHRPTGPAMVERLRWAGRPVPAVDLGGATDARQAMLMGYRGLALMGGEGESTPDGVRNAADVVESLVRMYAEDLARVEGHKTLQDEDEVA